MFEMLFTLSCYRLTELLKELGSDSERGKTIIFCTTKSNVDMVAMTIERQGYV